MKFACLVYHEQKEAVSEAEVAAIVEECQGAAAWNEAMRKGGHHVFTAGLQSVQDSQDRTQSERPSVSSPTALSPRPRRAWAG